MKSKSRKESFSSGKSSITLTRASVDFSQGPVGHSPYPSATPLCPQRARTEPWETPTVSHVGTHRSPVDITVSQVGPHRVPGGTASCPRWDRIVSQVGPHRVPGGTAPCPSGTAPCPSGTAPCPSGTPWCPTWERTVTPVGHHRVRWGNDPVHLPRRRNLMLDKMKTIATMSSHKIED
jgi:hypothetical protein